jgi:hypothetical protein
MTTPSAFKIVSLSSPSAFQSNEKVNKIYNTIPCTVKILPLVSSLVTYNDSNKLDLSGICTVRLAASGTATNPPTIQYAITTVTGLVPGQIVTFFNDNAALTYTIEGGTLAGGIIYTGGPAGVKTITALMGSGIGLTTTPAVGWYSSPTGMYFNN